MDDNDTLPEASSPICQIDGCEVHACKAMRFWLTRVTALRGVVLVCQTHHLILLHHARALRSGALHVPRASTRYDMPMITDEEPILDWE